MQQLFLCHTPKILLTLRLTKLLFPALKLSDILVKLGGVAFL